MGKVLASIRGIVVLIYTAFQILFLSVDTLINGKSIRLGYKHRGIWGRNSMRIEGIRLVELTGSIDVPVALIISNHRSMLDPIIQTGLMDAHIIAKDAVSGLPFIGKGAAMTGIIFVKRDKLRSRLEARNATKEALEQGYNVLVYAEGTTGTNRTSDAFKIGTFAVAAELNIPVVPVAIEYPEKEDFWTSGGLGTQVLRQTGKWRTNAKMRIGPPIHSTDPKELMVQSKEWIDSNLTEMQKGWSKMFPDQH